MSTNVEAWRARLQDAVRTMERVSREHAEREQERARAVDATKYDPLARGIRSRSTRIRGVRVCAVDLAAVMRAARPSDPQDRDLWLTAVARLAERMGMDEYQRREWWKACKGED